MKVEQFRAVVEQTIHATSQDLNRRLVEIQQRKLKLKELKKDFLRQEGSLNTLIGIKEHLDNVNLSSSEKDEKIDELSNKNNILQHELEELQSIIRAARESAEVLMEQYPKASGTAQEP